MELVKAIMLAVAFLFWAANQFWPNLPQATLFNDIAIALFVLDVFLVIVGLAANLAGQLLWRSLFRVLCERACGRPYSEEER